jgi:catechol 2,3-dioxygenase-like lactoylglutathione lyase family enzyme
MAFRLELFITDLAASVDFYSRVLKFKIGKQEADGYTPLTNGQVSLSLNLHASLPGDHPIKAVTNERLGRGIEIVLEVDDIHAMYQHVIAQNWPLSSELAYRPWGKPDFRLLDPDGYYWRITTF